jgi:SOS response regulatory protein OraA/RecX
MNYAFNALSRRSMTEFEMRDKLMKRFEKISGGANDILDDDVVSNVIARLKELNLVNDERYLIDFITANTNFRSIGKFGIFNKLRRKGIPKEIFERVWQDLDIEESSVLDKACEDFERKKGVVKGSQKQKERLMRYLAARGFPPDLIYKKLRESR